MPSSGSKDFAVTRNSIIQSAMRKIGAIDAQDSPSPTEISAAALALNAIVKEWVGEGVGLWLRQTSVLFLQQGQQVYTVGTGGNGYLVRQSVIYYAELSADPSGTNYVAIRLDDGSLDVKTSPSATATTVSVSGGITSAASAGAKVYVFNSANIATRPVRILTASRLDNSGNQAEVQLIGRADYVQLSQKAASGDPTMLHFDPQIPTAFISVWPSINSTSCDQLVLVTEHYPDDFDAANDNPQFPIEWANALIWNLAMELSFEYGVDVRTRSQIAQIAVTKKQTLLDTADRENASVTFTVGD
jgi:hypothetical protein